MALRDQSALFTAYFILFLVELISCGTSGTADLAVRKVLLRLSRLQSGSSTATRPLDVHVFAVPSHHPQGIKGRDKGLDRHFGGQGTPEP